VGVVDAGNVVVSEGAKPFLRLHETQAVKEAVGAGRQRAVRYCFIMPYETHALNEAVGAGRQRAARYCLIKTV
jgi:hypothetical protein